MFLTRHSFVIRRALVVLLLIEAICFGKVQAERPPKKLSGYRAFVVRQLDVPLRIMDPDGPSRRVRKGAIVKLLMHKGRLLAYDDVGVFEMNKADCSVLTNDLTTSLASLVAPRQFDILFASANYMSLINRSVAREFYQAALMLSPNDNDARIGWALVQSTPQQRILELERVTKDSPQHYWLAQTHIEKSRPNRDLNALTKIARQELRPQLVHIELLSHFIRTPAVDNVAHEWEQHTFAARKYGVTSQLLNLVAVGLMNEKLTPNIPLRYRQTEGLTYVDAALEVDPFYFTAAITRAGIKSSTGMKLAAAEDFELALQLNPLCLEAMHLAKDSIREKQVQTALRSKDYNGLQVLRTLPIGRCLTQLSRVKDSDIPIDQNTDLTSLIHGYAPVNHGAGQRMKTDRLIEIGGTDALDYLQKAFGFKLPVATPIANK